MYAISAIPSTMSARAIAPRPEIASPEIAPGTGTDPTLSPAQTTGAGSAQPASESFSNLLGRMVEEVSSKQTAANDAMRSVQSGGDVSLHQAVIAMEEANISFQLMVEVRNKLLDSYQEIMRMQV
jgi:flagellar hook-basal body complex protein FliE